MLLELLGLGILSLLGGRKKHGRITSKPEKKPINNEDTKPKEVTGIKKQLVICQIELKINTIHIQVESSNSLELYYSNIYDLPTLNESPDPYIYRTMTIKHNKDTYSLIFKNYKITSDDFELIQNKVINSISSIIHEFHTLAYNEYLRDTSIENIGIKLEMIVSNFKQSKDLWSSKFSEDVINQLLAWGEFLPLANGQIKLREQFESKALIERQEFFNKIESNPLTEQQRLAVIRNNDLNLVIAAAGTGKTSVIVAKA